MFEKLPEGIGNALINQRAGMESVVYNHLHAQRVAGRLSVRSRAFAFNARLPPQYTADGAGLSPPLAWDDVPGEADSIVLIVEDADSPTPHPLVHAIVVNLAPTDGSLDEGDLIARTIEASGWKSAAIRFSNELGCRRIRRVDTANIVTCFKSSPFEQERRFPKFRDAMNSSRLSSIAPSRSGA
jgi:hypothetical protein